MATGPTANWIGASTKEKLLTFAQLETCGRTTKGEKIVEHLDVRELIDQHRRLKAVRGEDNFLEELGRWRKQHFNRRGMLGGGGGWLSVCGAKREGTRRCLPDGERAKPRETQGTLKIGKIWR